MQSDNSKPTASNPQRIGPQFIAIAVFAVVAAVVFGIFAVFGEAGPVSALLAAWAGLLAVYVLYRLGYFAEKITLRLPGEAAPHSERMRRMNIGRRLQATSDPAYLGVDEANSAEDEVKPEDRVIGIEVGGHAIAYPLAAMAVREVAHEVMDGRHVFVTWWPVTYSARAFVLDEPGGSEPQLLDIRKMVLNSIVLQDSENEHIVQFPGQYVTGPRAGETLRQVPVVCTNWRAWSAAFPHTEVMSLQGTGAEDVFEHYYITNRAGLYQQSARDRRWHDKDTVLGVMVNGEAKAYPYPALIDRPLVQEELGGEPVMVLQERISATAVAFSRRVDGQALTFKADSRNPRRPTAEPGETDIRRRIQYEPWWLVDEQTGSRWRAISGECVSGKLKGNRLEMLPSQTGFWFAWSRFYPHAQVMEPRSPGKDDSS